MSFYDKFQKRMVLSGESVRDDMLQQSKNFIIETFEDDLSYTENFYFWKMGKEKAEDYINDGFYPLRIYKKSFSNANGEVVKFQTLPDSYVDVGEIFYDKKENTFWICTESFDLDGICCKGKLTRCNWILRWIDKNGNILSYPCQDMNATQYNSGERGNRQFVIGSSQHILTLPCDENTKLLSTPTRFFLSKDTNIPIIYKVTQNDTTSFNYGKNGLCKVTVAQDSLNLATDNLELGICDYIQSKDKGEDIIGDIVAKIEYKKDSIKVGGNAQVFRATFRNKNNENVVTSYRWEVICDFREDLNVVNLNNGDISIQTNSDKLIGEFIKLKLISDDGLYDDSLLIKINPIF